MTIRARLPFFGCLFALTLLISGNGSGAEPAPPVAPVPAKTEESVPKAILEVEPAPSIDSKTATSLQTTPKAKPQKKRVYGGSFTKFSKTKKPFQLLNPFAPKKYGTGDDVVNRDPTTGKVQGVNLFTVEF